MSEREILFLNPMFTHNVWGGSRLREEFGYDVEGTDVGECWGISAHPNAEGTIRGGAYAGEKLSALWEKHPEIFGNVDPASRESRPGLSESAGYGRFPLLVKIIDAKEDLSIQVHPDDAYAKAHENGVMGKAECWYVLDCQPGAKLVLGHNAADRRELEDMIHQGQWGELIREVPVKKGDFIRLDPGTVHAIKGGMLILEIQQNSDITYRIYDYGRLSSGKPRQLHVEQGIEVITVPAAPVENIVVPAAQLKGNCVRGLCSCEYFRVAQVKVSDRLVVILDELFPQDTLSPQSGASLQAEQFRQEIPVMRSVSFLHEVPFLAMTVVSGGGMVNSRAVRKGDYFLVPNGVERLELQGEMELIAASV